MRYLTNCYLCPYIYYSSYALSFDLQGQDYLADLSGVKYLVVDEADRMVESGHFRELKMIANLLRNPSRASDVNTL